MITHDLVLRDDHATTAVLILNRPEARNALSRALIARLNERLDEALADPAVRAIVLAGAGSVFCAGMDLKEALTADDDPLLAFALVLEKLHTALKPTIAAVHGDAIAGGAGLVTACDIAIADESARIGYPEVKRGLVASIVMHDLLEHVGPSRARRLLLTGDLIPARLASHWGLVTEVAPANECRAEAVRLAARLTASAPAALATVKRLLDEATFRPDDPNLAVAESAAARRSEEAREGIQAFLEKRPPAWDAST